MLVDLTTQLDKTQRLLRQLMEAKSGTRSEQLSADQLRLFGQDLPVAQTETEAQKDDDLPPGTGSEDKEESSPRGRLRWVWASGQRKRSESRRPPTPVPARLESFSC